MRHTCVNLGAFLLYYNRVCTYQSTRDAFVSSIVPAILSHKSLRVVLAHDVTAHVE